MDQYYNEFKELLEKEDRYECIKYVKKLLDNKKVNIAKLYENMIRPSLENITCKVDMKDMCIWQEHVRSGIVRTVIENCYTYVIDEASDFIKQNKGKVVVLCPEEEYHDIGARMISDLFIIAGYDTIFVGSNTPKEDFIAAAKYIKPDYIAISVTNYYNLVAAKEAIKNIKEKLGYNVTVIAGGNAFKSEKDVYKKIGADIFIDTYEDIKSIGGV